MSRVEVAQTTVRLFVAGWFKVKRGREGDAKCCATCM